MAKVGRLFGIYHMMEERGVFDQNKNNAQSPGYVRAEYPKMLFHPKGKEHIVFAGISEVSPDGRTKLVGQQTEIVNRIVASKAEEDEWLAKGWLTHPADAMRAAGKDAPATSSQARIDDLETQMARLREELVQAKRAKLTDVGELDENVA